MDLYDVDSREFNAPAFFKAVDVVKTQLVEKINFPFLTSPTSFSVEENVNLQLLRKLCSDGLGNISKIKIPKEASNYYDYADKHLIFRELLLECDNNTIYAPYNLITLETGHSHRSPVEKALLVADKFADFFNAKYQYQFVKIFSTSALTAFCQVRDTKTDSFIGKYSEPEVFKDITFNDARLLFRVKFRFDIYSRYT